ncbi:MAG TPA: hypothetical protein VM513_22985 [Kofleriaceae bacterium]|jgi:hypothetical protein|nr:hypothetical protein [Kofleriaceae bacterium]
MSVVFAAVVLAAPARSSSAPGRSRGPTRGGEHLARAEEWCEARPVTRLIGALAFLALGCGSTSSPPPPPTNTAAAAVRTDEARRYLLGDEVPRDYRKAAALYRTTCGEGCGEQPACEALLGLALAGRGTVLGRSELAVAARLCDRGLPEACLVAGFKGVRDEKMIADKIDMKAVAARCDAGDVGACRSELATDLGLGGGSSHQERLAELRVRVCLDGKENRVCAEHVKTMWYECETRGQRCIDQLVAEAKGMKLDDHAKTIENVWARIRSACDAGDADACEAVPGRELAARVLCDAGDFAACDKLAEGGDAHAARVACEGGVTTRCLPPQPLFAGVPSYLRDACKGGSQEACELIAKETPAACP